jgi:hypothetical protein
MNACLPLDANPREPAVTSQVKEMQECLEKTPGDFFKKNNGLTTLCESVSFDEVQKKCTLQFSKGEGVCNGGHTYFAIVTHASGVSEKALVHLEVIEFPKALSPKQKMEEIVKIARARNNNNRLARRSEADFLGYYDGFKKRLANAKWVGWHEGDAEAAANAIPAEHFIRLLAAVDPEQFYHPIFNKRGARHKSAVTGIRGIHNAWCDKMEEFETSGGIQAPMVYMAPLANDILTLGDGVRADLRQDSGVDFGKTVRKTGFYQKVLSEAEQGLQVLLTDPSRKGCAIPATVEVLLLGLFRTNVWLNMREADTVISHVGWYFDPFELWQSRRADVLEALGRHFADVSQDPLRFVRVSAPYECDLFTLGLGQTPPMPAIIYSVDTGERWVRAEAGTGDRYRFMGKTGEFQKVVAGGGDGESKEVYVRV